MNSHLVSLCMKLIILLACSVIATQASDSTFVPAANKANSFSIGMDKNANIHNFFSDLDIRSSIWSVDFILTDKFRSTAIKTSELNFRDDNIFKLELSRSIFDKFSLGIENYFVYNLDSRPIGNNKLFEFSSIPNIKFEFLDNSFLRIGVGREFNEKVGIKSQGTALYVNGALNDYHIEDVGINSQLFLKSTTYQDERINRTLTSFTHISSNYSQHNNISFDLNYSDNLRDFINFVDIKQNQYLFEKNGDKNIDASIAIDYNPFEELMLNSRLNYSAQSKKREFNKSSEQLSTSFFNRESQILKVQLANSAVFSFDNLMTGINIDYESIEETFNSTPINSDVSPTSAAAFQNTQKMNDYSSTRFRLASNSIISIARFDSLILDLSASIYQYDTPHKDNNDEHDESYSGIFVKYFHTFSKHLRLAVSGELKNQHYVYLKAEKSGQSNELKSLRFKPEMVYTTKYLYWNPQFEILANYHIFDFQAKLNSVSTFSFRQLSYQDSIALNLTEHIVVGGNIMLRYSERSVLYWEDFSEKPIKGNLEQMYKVMIYNKMSNITFGIGTGMYKYIQSDLQKTSGKYTTIIFSPEAVIGIIFSSKGKLNINCKYDFQNIGGVHREVANISLKTEIAF